MPKRRAVWMLPPSLTLPSSNELAPGGRRRNEGDNKALSIHFLECVRIDKFGHVVRRGYRNVSEYEHAVVEAFCYIQRHHLPVRDCGPLSNAKNMAISQVNVSWGGGSKGGNFPQLSGLDTHDA